MKKILTFCLLALASFSISCSQTSQAEPNVDIDAQGPVIKFKDLNHDFGTIEQDGNGTYEFEFKNEGNEPLLLENVRSSCGCTIPQWPKEPIAPGQSSNIVVKYDTRRVGSFSKSITVSSNGSEIPITLSIRGTVEAKAAAQ
ncbi:MAG: DUF1573 domain-containing protein [Bacteroidota bacterium]|nr:MAG: DUF1573 domain-containing protein [Bacteroidota bacterium]